MAEVEHRADSRSPVVHARTTSPLSLRRGRRSRRGVQVPAAGPSSSSARGTFGGSWFPPGAIIERAVARNDDEAWRQHSLSANLPAPPTQVTHADLPAPGWWLRIFCCAIVPVSVQPIDQPSISIPRSYANAREKIAADDVAHRAARRKQVAAQRTAGGYDASLRRVAAEVVLVKRDDAADSRGATERLRSSLPAKHAHLLDSVVATATAAAATVVARGSPVPATPPRCAATVSLPACIVDHAVVVPTDGCQETVTAHSTSSCTRELIASSPATAGVLGGSRGALRSAHASASVHSATRIVADTTELAYQSDPSCGAHAQYGTSRGHRRVHRHGAVQHLQPEDNGSTPTKESLGSVHEVRHGAHVLLNNQMWCGVTDAAVGDDTNDLITQVVVQGHIVVHGAVRGSRSRAESDGAHTPDAHPPETHHRPQDCSVLQDAADRSASSSSHSSLAADRIFPHISDAASPLDTSTVAVRGIRPHSSDDAVCVTSAVVAGNSEHRRHRTSHDDGHATRRRHHPQHLAGPSSGSERLSKFAHHFEPTLKPFPIPRLNNVRRPSPYPGKGPLLGDRAPPPALLCRDCRVAGGIPYASLASVSGKKELTGIGAAARALPTEDDPYDAELKASLAIRTAPVTATVTHETPQSLTVTGSMPTVTPGTGSHNSTTMQFNEQVSTPPAVAPLLCASCDAAPPVAAPPPAAVLERMQRRRPCLVLDLDETLVHSSFLMKPPADDDVAPLLPDHVLTVPMDGENRKIYVVKRPGCDEFLDVRFGAR